MTKTPNALTPAVLSPDKVNIDYAANDSCEIQCWSRGHVAPETFLAACELALEAWDGRKVNLRAARVAHNTWRTVRAPAEVAEYGVCEFIHVPSAPGRGAYPVTVLEDWLPLHAAL